tara:strand:+ start:691 stop:1257 length:567 start_codon:yes stop_codon:yes gene_type:complete
VDNFIHQFNINENICSKLIEYHKGNIEYKFQGANSNKVVDKNIKDSIDVAVYPSSNHPDVEAYFLELKKGLNSFFKVNSFPEPNNIRLSLFTQEGFNIQHYPAGGGYKDWHFERTDIKGHIITRTLVFMTYLNDVEDQGETEFHFQKVKIKPKKGLSLIWPADFTYTHRGIPSPTEQKYIATGWFNMV